jgi:F-type H+-transporting ATPase subunit b
MAGAPQALVMAAEEAATTAAHGGGEGGGSFPPFDPSLFASQLVWFVLTFVALYLIMGRYILPKIATTMERRESAIAGDLDLAAQKSAEAESARESMERAVAKARADARAMVDAARAEAAEARLAERIRVAEGRVDAARAKALAEVPALAEGLAREIADKIAPQAVQRQRVAAQGEA